MGGEAIPVHSDRGGRVMVSHEVRDLLRQRWHLILIGVIVGVGLSWLAA